jgi:hypothetical protein
MLNPVRGVGEAVKKGVLWPIWDIINICYDLHQQALLLTKKSNAQLTFIGVILVCLSPGEGEPMEWCPIPVID